MSAPKQDEFSALTQFLIVLVAFVGLTLGAMAVTWWGEPALLVISGIGAVIGLFAIVQMIRYHRPARDKSTGTGGYAPDPDAPSEYRLNDRD